jgi:hypothetical protein
MAPGQTIVQVAQILFDNDKPTMEINWKIVPTAIK